jgi:MoCo/4Fe-4S cofactor protein with predicted Tat translocation signal
MNSRKNLASELAALQERLASSHGKRYWRTLEELADSEAFQQLMRREFPSQAAVWPDGLSRRKFLTLMGASLALAGVSGCSPKPAPATRFAPYVRAPEEMAPGKPLFFATAMTLGGAGVGLLVESHLGRPTKIEGNPEHPASRGATDLFHQGSILTLYDPDRSQTPTYLGQTRTWEAALNAVRRMMRAQRAKKGAGLRLLTETVVSPTLGAQLDDLLRALPEARWHQYEPLGPHSARRANQLAFGQPLNTYYRFYDFEKKQRTADIVLSFDADFLTCGPGSLRYVAEFMAGRRVRTGKEDAANAQMNRLYMVETAVSSTGAKADHRLALRAQDIEPFARAVAAQLGMAVEGGDALGHERWIAAVAKDLQAHRGRCVVLAGERQSPAVHVLAHVLNDRLGNVGQTVFHTPSIETRSVDQIESLREFVSDVQAGRVETLIILGGNPAFTAPADVEFVRHLQKVPPEGRLHLSLFQDETSRQCGWHLPEAHFLEMWSDTRAFDGTASLVQPLIAPLYGGRSAHELLSVLMNEQEIPGRLLVRSYWQRFWEEHRRSGDFEEFWEVAVHDGIVAGSDYDFRHKSIPFQNGWEKQLQSTTNSAGGQELELVLQHDATIYDGRFANNGWLQELPKPITTLTWDNAALMSPRTAKQLDVGLRGYEHGGEHGGFQVDVVELRLGDRSVQAPIWIVPGHADGAITISLGYGRDAAGRVGGDRENKVGFNAYALRTSERLWFAPGLSAAKTGELYPLACTQQHQLMENRDIVRSATLDQYQANPAFAAVPNKAHRKKDVKAPAGRIPLEQANAEKRSNPSLLPAHDYSPPKKKWGMVIDLTACVGCKACVVACQAENNIPVVGKEQVLAGREMHWLRIDRYSSGSYEEPEEFHFQPLPCMHCENAPCEYVCPVEATVHSSDGLNDMVYQRCVGTRFCQNNCPYKVRRFNFFHYADFTTPSLRLQYNPDVTVRSRGVMEKCSYCVQRIRRAEIDAEVEGRAIVDQEILTACQAACPAEAIVFGDLNDPQSTVKRWKDTPLNYGLLTDLNTEPRTTYLAALRNPNPELETK